MRRIYKRAMAVFLAVIVSFNGLIYRPVEVQANPIVVPLVKWLISATFGWLLGKGLDWTIDQFDKDKEGNIIITAEALEQMKKDYMEQVEEAAAQIPGTRIRLEEIDVTQTGPEGSEAHAYAMAQRGCPGMYLNQIPSGMLSEHLYYTTLSGGFYVEGKNGAISVYSADLKLKDNEYHEFDGNFGYVQSNVGRTVEAAGSLYGGDILVFESLQALQEYHAQFERDPESVPLMPYTRETVGGTEKEVMVWNPITNTSQSIFDVDIDLEHGIVITPDGQIYLNYSDENGNGIPDDHDPELETGLDADILYMNTENGWYSGNVQLADDWRNYDMLSFTYGSPGDGGHNGAASGVWYMMTSDLQTLEHVIFSGYYRRYFAFDVNTDDYTTLQYNRSAADGEVSDRIPRIYIIRGYNFNSRGNEDNGNSNSMNDLYGSNNSHEYDSHVHGNLYKVNTSYLKHYQEDTGVLFSELKDISNPEIKTQRYGMILVICCSASIISIILGIAAIIFAIQFKKNNGAVMTNFKS